MNRMKNKLHIAYEEVISIGNLLSAWEEFVRGKRRKADVQAFAYDLFARVASLHDDLRGGAYRHGPYKAFNICDPKPRRIHKASVRDRLLHHAIHRKLYPIFARMFISDSFSCQTSKGLHRAINCFRRMTWRVSRNNTRTCWVLKCDVRKFFAIRPQFNRKINNAQCGLIACRNKLLTRTFSFPNETRLPPGA